MTKTFKISIFFFFIATALAICFDPQVQAALKAILDILPHLTKTFDQSVQAVRDLPDNTKDLLKFLSSKAILLFLLFFMSVFTFISLSLKDDLAKKISFFLTFVLFSGLVGYLYQPYDHPIQSYEHVKERRDHPLSSGDIVTFDVTFKNFTPDVEAWLLKAAKGEVRLLLQPSLTQPFSDDSFQGSIKIGNTAVVEKTPDRATTYLSTQQVADFIRLKKINFSYKKINGPPTFIAMRDMNTSLKSRQDTVTLNGSLLDLGGDSVFLLFSFEDLEGHPLVSFY